MYKIKQFKHEQLWRRDGGVCQILCHVNLAMEKYESLANPQEKVHEMDSTLYRNTPDYIKKVSEVKQTFKFI